MTELPTYYTNVNQTLLQTIPKDARRVLEIGCGAGAMGQAYCANVNTECEYWGVEYVPEVADIAKGVLEKVIVGSIEEEEVYNQLPQDYFDVLIFGDVLEHLSDPWSVLKILSKHMRLGGVCVACIPNTQHWSILTNLLSGNWEYQDSGLMDRTHLRFFTRKSMVSMFEQNGWRVTAQQPRIFPNKASGKVINEIGRIRENLGLKDPFNEQEFLALQWVISAEVRKKETPIFVAPKKRLMVNICGFVENFMDVRVRLPARDLARINEVDTTISIKQINLSELRNFDGPSVCILQRPRVTDLNSWYSALSMLNEIGCVPIYELDDHPDLLLQQQGADHKLVAASVSAVQTSTEKLSDFFKATNPETMWFDNACHDLSIFEPVRFNESPIVFYGALNRETYSPEIARRINPILQKHNAGCHVIADKPFFDALSIPNKRFDQPLNYECYLAAMRRCQIMLTPLEGMPGEEYKSDVKFVEASSQGLATIASPLVYGDTIRHGETGLLSKNMDEWPELLDSLLSSMEERKRIAKNAWDYVRRERLFTEQAPLRIQWYLDLWERRDELWAKAEKRVPELRSPAS